MHFLVLLLVTEVMSSSSLKWEEPKEETDYNRLKAAVEFYHECEEENGYYKSQHPYEPFIKGAVLSPYISLYPKMKVLLITSDRYYPTEYDNDQPELLVTFKKVNDKVMGVESINKTYKYNINTKKTPMKTHLWNEYFYPLPNIEQSYSFINGDTTNQTQHFVVMLSYPIDENSLQEVIDGYEPSHVQIISHCNEYNTSNYYELTGNVLEDYDYESCMNVYQEGLSTDYKRAMENWHDIMESTGWSESSDISLLITFSIDHFFCIGSFNYIFFGDRTKITKNWKYCQHYYGDIKWSKDPCCNKSLSTKCSSYNERPSLLLSREMACNYDMKNERNKNLSDVLLIELYNEAHSLEDLTQRIHDLHYFIVPTLIYSYHNNKDDGYDHCNYILQNPEEFYSKNNYCPMTLEKYSNYSQQIDKGKHCYVPTEDESFIYSKICSLFYNDGMIDFNLTDEFGTYIEHLANMITVNVTDDLSDVPDYPFYCVSYNGMIFGSDNEECK